MPSPRRSLRTELLVNLGFVTSAAVILVGLNTVLLLGGSLDEAWQPMLVLWLTSTTVFVLFGWYLVHRVVLGPLERLSGEAAVAGPGRDPGAAAGPRHPGAGRAGRSLSRHGRGVA